MDESSHIEVSLPLSLKKYQYSFKKRKERKSIIASTLPIRRYKSPFKFHAIPAITVVHGTNMHVGPVYLYQMLP